MWKAGKEDGEGEKGDDGAEYPVPVIWCVGVAVDLQCFEDFYCYCEDPVISLISRDA